MDVCDAFAYIYENSFSLNLNSKNICLVSDSAGSFLTLAAFALMKDENFRRIFNLSARNVDISSMAFISPMTHLLESGSLSLINSPARFDLNDEEKSFTDNILKAFEDINLPSSIVVTSKEDFIRDQAKSIKNFLEGRDVKNIFLDFKKTDDYPLGHGFAVSHPDFSESKMVLNEISNFFNSF